MRTSIFLAGALATLARAQGFDWDAIDAADPAPSVTVPVGAGSPTAVAYNSETAIVSVAEDIAANPLPQATDSPEPEKRDVEARGACDPQPLGYGVVPSPDTAQAFVAYTGFSDAAKAAGTPSGYLRAFKNLKGSSQTYAYMGYSTMKAYDTGLCATRCNAISGCSSFNVYFERAPTVDPATSCPNPPSTTVIKCVYWGAPLYAATATNTGQWRNDFQVVIAGSNGYVRESVPAQDGYDGPVYLENAAINAPLDCSNSDTYLGVKIFTQGPFDVSLCAAACTTQTEYNLAHPPATKPVQTCQFFNTFLLLKNDKIEAQHCSLYSMAWDASYAKNTGQWRGNDRYTVASSYSFTNSTSPGGPRYPCTA